VVKLFCLTNRKSGNQLWQLGSVHEIYIFLRGHVSFKALMGEDLHSYYEVNLHEADFSGLYPTFAKIESKSEMLCLIYTIAT